MTPCENQQSKRMLKGLAKDKVLESMVKDKKSAIATRLEEANKLMNYGDPEPSHLPTLNALRCAKYKVQDEANVDKDIYASLNIAKFTTPYQESIKDIGFNKFYVKYWTPSQVNAYREFTKKNKTTAVFVVDATGKVVKKLRRPFSNKSSAIFLYQAKVYDESTGMEFPVCQMISERHDNMAIYSWLYDWIKQSVPTPPSCVSDRSIAILSGAVQAFTQYKTLSEYLIHCYNVLFFDEIEELPKCFVRCDIAHLIKNITCWKPLKKLTPNVRVFYVHSIAELLKANSVGQVENIVKALCQLASSTTVGKKLENGIPTSQDVPAESARKLLRDIISNSTHNEDVLISTCEDAVIADEEKYLDSRDEMDFEKEIDNNPFMVWGKEIFKKNDQSDGPIGEYDSAFYCPLLLTHVLDLVNNLPLVSAVMVDKFGFGQQTATSAKIETTFNVVKHLLFQEKELPMRADHFVTRHIMAIEGELKLFATNFLLSQRSQQDNEEISEEFYDEQQIPSDKKELHETTKNSGTDISLIFPCNVCKDNKQQNTKPCVNCKSLICEMYTCSRPVPGSDQVGQIVCLECFEKVPEENYIRENWKGEGYTPHKENKLTVKPTKRPIFEPDEKKTKKRKGEGDTPQKENKSTVKPTKRPIFEPDEKKIKKQRVNKSLKSYLVRLPELGNMDTSGKTITQVSILKNGNRASELKPHTSKLIPQKQVTLTNTCAFDSFCQVLACAYNDSTSHCFKDLFEMTNLNSLTFKFLDFCKDLASKPISTGTYKKRLDLLVLSFKESIEHLPGDTLLVNTESTAADIVKRFTMDVPSFTDIHTCSTSNCKENKTISNPILQITLPYTGAAGIEEWLNIIIKQEKTTCGSCGNTKCLRVEVSPTWLFLELYDITHNSDSDVMEETEVREYLYFVCKIIIYVLGA